MAPVRTKIALICSCGHRGYLWCEESPSRERHYVEGFEGTELTVERGGNRPVNLLQRIKPKCPCCGRVGAVKYG